MTSKASDSSQGSLQGFVRVETFLNEKINIGLFFVIFFHYPIYLLTYMGVFGLDFVIELLPDEAAQTHNPYTILNPYHMWML